MSERLKVTLALVGSALLHLLFAAALLLGTWWLPASQPAESVLEPKTIEVTLMSDSPPEPPPEPKPVIAAAPTPEPKVTRSLLDTEGLAESKAAPENPAFESDKNSVAASEKPATGNVPLPSQEGKQRPAVNFKTQNYSLGKNAEPNMETEAAPSAPPKESAPPEPMPAQTPAPSLESFEKDAATPADPASTPAPLFTPTPLPIPDANAFPLGKPTPVPFSSPRPSPTSSPHEKPERKEVAMLATRPEPRAQPPRPESGYRAEKEQTKIEGSISNRGRPGVDAVGTPLGRYRKAIADAIGSRWYYYINQRMDLITVGDVHIKFLITETGQVQSVRILSNTANNTFGEFCMRSVTEAKIPPLPPDVASKLEDGKLEIEYHFTVYPQ